MKFGDGNLTVTVTERNTKFGKRFLVTHKFTKECGEWFDEHSLKTQIAHWARNGIHQI
jgi:hypothetical protein